MTVTAEPTDTERRLLERIDRLERGVFQPPSTKESVLPTPPPPQPDSFFGAKYAAEQRRLEANRAAAERAHQEAVEAARAAAERAEQIWAENAPRRAAAEAELPEVEAEFQAVDARRRELLVRIRHLRQVASE